MIKRYYYIEWLVGRNCRDVREAVPNYMVRGGTNYWERPIDCYEAMAELKRRTPTLQLQAMQSSNGSCGRFEPVDLFEKLNKKSKADVSLAPWLNP